MNTEEKSHLLRMIQAATSALSREEGILPSLIDTTAVDQYLENLAASNARVDRLINNYETRIRKIELQLEEVKTTNEASVQNSSTINKTSFIDIKSSKHKQKTNVTYIWVTHVGSTVKESEMIGYEFTEYGTECIYPPCDGEIVQLTEETVTLQPNETVTIAKIKV
jgi:hypothetical protein